MLRIRLTRTGKRNDARFRIVVAEHTKPVKGKFISILGHYDPIHKDIVIKKEEILNWLDKGAKPSNKVAILLKNEGVKHKLIVIQKFNKKPKNKKKGSEETQPSESPVAPKVAETDGNAKTNSETKNDNVDKEKVEGKEESKSVEESTKKQENSDDKK